MSTVLPSKHRVKYGRRIFDQRRNVPWAQTSLELFIVDALMLRFRYVPGAFATEAFSPSPFIAGDWTYSSHTSD